LLLTLGGLSLGGFVQLRCVCLKAASTLAFISQTPFFQLLQAQLLL